MCAAVSILSCLDATGKYLSQFIDPVQVAWSRYASALVLAAMYANPYRDPDVLKSRRPWLQIIRSLIMVAGTVLIFYALRHLQLDQLTTIMFSQPFLIALLSVPLLGERIGWQRWAAISVGFCGVLVVTRPSFDGVPPAIILAIIAAVMNSLFAVTTRLLSKFDSDRTTFFYSNLIATLAMTIMVPAVWQTPTTWSAVALLGMTGIIGGVGHILLIMAYRQAPAGVVAPFIYTQLIWAATLGYLIFGTMPTQWTLVGGAIVVASGLYLFYFDRPVPRTKPSRDKDRSISS